MLALGRGLLVSSSALQVQHGEVVLRQHMAKLGGQGEVLERLPRIRLHAPTIQVHHPQMEPRLHMSLP